MNPARYERNLARAKARYARAATRFTLTMTDWQRAAVPVAMADDAVPCWTPRQRDLAERAAGAWGELVDCHRAWEQLLAELGYQR